MKVVAFIPVKLNNERVPGKNTKCFSDGTPLMTLIQRTLLKCEEIDEVYCYCSNENVKEYLIEGVNFKNRDKRFDSNSADVNEMFLQFTREVVADIYVLAHATAPFLKSKSIDTAVRKVKKGKYNSALTVVKQQDFAWKDGKTLNYDIKRVPRTQDLPVIYIETTGCYIFTKEVIQEQRSRIGNRPYLLVVSKFEAIDNNEQEDFVMADAVYNYKQMFWGYRPTIIKIKMHSISSVREVA